MTRENLVPLFDIGPLFAFGLVSFIVAPTFLLLAVNPLEGGMYRHPLILATLHTALLGWGTSIALGALQQMAPVVFGTQLFSPRLSRWISTLFVTGVTALVAGFFTLSSVFLYVGAALVPIAIILAVLNVWRTQKESTIRAAQLIRPYVKSSLIYLLLAVLAGSTLAVNLVTGWLHGFWLQIFPGHVTFGLVGWFAMLVLGISYHLLPFFGLTPKKKDPRWADAVRILLHVGIVGHWLATFHAQFQWLSSVASGVLAVAITLFLSDAWPLFSPRPANKIHPMVTYVRFAHVYLALFAVALVYSLVAPLDAKFTVWVGVLGIGGWLTNTIVGYLHRILPFFVWHNKYWGRATEPGVPSFREMVSEGPAWLGLALYNAGVIGILVGLIATIPLTGYVGLVVAGTLISGGNLVRTLFR